MKKKSKVRQPTKSRQNKPKNNLNLKSSPSINPNKEYNPEHNKDYFLTTLDENGKFLVYESNKYKFSEIDLLLLIRILIVERRNKMLGEKILEVYEDSTRERNELTKNRLQKIGIDKEDNKPEVFENPERK